MKRLQWRNALTLLSLSLLCACAKTPAPVAQQNVQWLRDGMIAISRPLPSVSHAPAQGLLGFMPIPRSSAHVGSWISLDTGTKALSVMSGETKVASLSGQGIEGLKPGAYQLLHKQKNALWYAPDSYFTARNLPIPAQGDRNRYRRGALGEFVLYIDKDTPLYSGPIWDAEIGGVRIEESEMSRLYSLIDIGSAVEVR